MRVVLRVVFDTIDGYNRDAAALLGAGIAYYGLLAVAPLLLVVLAILSPLLGEQVARHEVFAVLTDWLGGPGADAIKAVLLSASEAKGGRIATLLGVVFTVFGTVRLFNQVQRALDRVWGVAPSINPIGQAIAMWAVTQGLSVLLVLAVCTMLVASLAANTMLAGLHPHNPGGLCLDTWVLRTLESLATTVILTAMFTFVFKVLPHVRVRTRDVLPGAMFTAVLLVVAKHAIGTYLGTFGARTALGAAGAIVFVVLWMSWSAQVVLLGAEFTRAWAVHLGDGMRPGRGFHRVDRVQVSQRGTPVEASSAGKYTPEAADRMFDGEE